MPLLPVDRGETECGGGGVTYTWHELIRQRHCDVRITQTFPFVHIKRYTMLEEPRRFLRESAKHNDEAEGKNAPEGDAVDEVELERRREWTKEYAVILPMPRLREDEGEEQRDTEGSERGEGGEGEKNEDMNDSDPEGAAEAGRVLFQTALSDE